VNQRFLANSVFCVSIALLFNSCISSEETGAGNRAKTPVQVFGSIDTTHQGVRGEVHRDITLKTETESSEFMVAKSQRIAPKFKSKQDTVRASIVTKSKSSSRPFIKIERPEHPVYTVQIGAFTQASNALRVQKKAKERFVHQPIFNNFVKTAKLYRISVGRYKDSKDAFTLRDTMKQNFPKEYKECWINFIP
jgi:cell division septation protein DedD